MVQNATCSGWHVRGGKPETKSLGNPVLGQQRSGIPEAGPDHVNRQVG